MVVKTTDNVISMEPTTRKMTGRSVMYVLFSFIILLDCMVKDFFLFGFKRADFESVNLYQSSYFPRFFLAD